MNSNTTYFSVVNLYVLTDEVLDILLSNDIFETMSIEGDAGELDPPG